MPGASRSITAAVASGVRSEGLKPVPPVVRTRSKRSSSAQWRRRSGDQLPVVGENLPADDLGPEPARQTGECIAALVGALPAARDVERVSIAARTLTPAEAARRPAESSRRQFPLRPPLFSISSTASIAPRARFP